MREILFRGKRIDINEWIEGYYAVSPTDSKSYIYAKDYTEVDIAEDGLHVAYRLIQVFPTTVGQYIGLTDKNGEKIFEGDICKFREWDNGKMCWIGYVHFEHCQFIISGGANEECPSNFHLVLSRFSPENIEVIGNIHDNPELLEVKE